MPRLSIMQWRTEEGGRGWGVKPPPPQKKILKILQNRAKITRLWKLLRIAEFRTPTHQDVRKKGSKILKLPSVRNCFTLAMINKLVVIVNSLKVPKIKKILPYRMKFLYQITVASRTPDWGATATRSRSLCPLSSTEFVDPPPRTKFLGTPLQSWIIYIYIYMPFFVLNMSQVSCLKVVTALWFSSIK